MFQSIIKVLLHTIIIDFAFALCIYIFGNRKRIIQYVKKNWFILILAFGFSFWMLSIIFSCLGIKDDSESQKYFSVETLYSCYVAIVIGAITLYFTVFSFIKPKKMTLSNYVKYLIEPNDKILYFSMIPMFIINTISIFLNINNAFYRIALVDSIFTILAYLTNGIYKFSYIENIQIASKIFVTKVCTEIKKEKLNKKYDDNIVVNLFNEYLNPCFPENSFNVAFQDYESIINQYLKQDDKSKMILDFTSKSISVFKDFSEKQIKTIMVNEVKANQIVYVMDRIIDSNIKFILKNYNNNQEKYFEEILTTCSKLYEIWFSLYRELICTGYNNLQYSMLLEGGEPLTFGLMFIENNNQKIAKKFKCVFENFIFKSHEICILILHQSDFITFRNFLQDYIRITQFMTYKDSCYDLIRYQNYYLIVIGTYIANLYEEKRISGEYLRFLPFILEEVNAIEIGLQTVLYTKLLDLTGFHDNPKTFLYYLILLIIYSLPQIPDNEAEKWLDNIISKIKIIGKEYNIYSTILNIIHENFGEYNNYKDEIDLLKDKLTILKNKYDDSQKKIVLGKLKQTIKTNQMQEYIKNDLNRYNEHFSYCEIYGNEPYKKILLPKGFSFEHSGKYIIGESSNDIFGIYDHFRIIDAFIYNEYINQAIITNVSTLDEIITNTEDNEITLICAIKYHMYIYTLKNIQYEGPNCIKYNDKVIHLIFDRNLTDYIIIRNNLKRSIFMKTISESSLISNLETEDTTSDVVIPYEPCFYINTKSDIRVYSIIGVKDI